MKVVNRTLYVCEICFRESLSFGTIEKCEKVGVREKVPEDIKVGDIIEFSGRVRLGDMLSSKAPWLFVVKNMRYSPPREMHTRARGWAYLLESHTLLFELQNNDPQKSGSRRITMTYPELILGRGGSRSAIEAAGIAPPELKSVLERIREKFFQRC